MAKGSGGGGRAGRSRGSAYSPAKLAAVREGRRLPIETGDWINALSMRTVIGEVTGRGTLGRTGIEVFKIRTPRGGEDAIPVADAQLLGFAQPLGA